MKNSHNTKKAFSKTKQYSRKVMNQLAASEEYKISGNYRKAIEIAERILLEDPECLAAVEELADNFLSLDYYDQAEKAANYALTLNAESYIANYTKGFLDLSRGHWKQAVDHLNIANKTHHNNPEILRCLGWGMFHTGKRLEGLAILDRALNLRSDDPMILCDLGVCCLHCDAYEKAIMLFKKALSIAPDNQRAQECLEAVQDLQQKLNSTEGVMPIGEKISKDQVWEEGNDTLSKAA